MPQGKGTYGDQVGRPPEEDKPFKMMGHELPGPNQRVNTMDNTMGGEEKGKNAELIEALKDQDEASLEIEKLKQSTGDSSISTTLNQ
jgi:hypothetical protein